MQEHNSAVDYSRADNGDAASQESFETAVQENTKENKRNLDSREQTSPKRKHIIQENSSIADSRADTLSQESFEQRLWNQNTVEDYLKQMVGANTLESSDEDEDYDDYDDQSSYPSLNGIRSLSDINIEEVASLVEYLQEMMEAAVLNNYEADDCDLSTLPDAIKAMEGLKINDDESASIASASLASLVEKHKLRPSTLEKILKSKSSNGSRDSSHNIRNSEMIYPPEDDNNTIDELYIESERQEESYLNTILGRIPAEAEATAAATRSTNTIRKGVHKTFQDRQGSTTTNENDSLAGNETIDRVVAQMMELGGSVEEIQQDNPERGNWTDFAPIAASVTTPMGSIAENINDDDQRTNRFVSDDTSVGSISEDIEVIVANHKKRLEDEVGAIHNMEKDTMVSSLSFENTHYAKIRSQQLGGINPNEVLSAVTNEIDTLDEETGGSNEDWWVKAEKHPSENTPSPQNSIGKSKEAPNTPSTVLVVNNMLGLVTPVGSEMDPYELEENRAYKRKSPRKSSKWDRIPILKRAFDRYGFFIVWVMISALSMLVLCVILVIAGFARLDNSENQSNDGSPLSPPIKPPKDDILPTTKPPIKPYPTLDLTFDEEEFYPITGPLIDDEDDEVLSTQIPSSDFWSSFYDDNAQPIDDDDAFINENDPPIEDEIDSLNSVIEENATGADVFADENATDISDLDDLNSFADENTTSVNAVLNENPTDNTDLGEFVNENATQISDLDEGIFNDFDGGIDESSIGVEFAFFEERIRNTLADKLPESLVKLRDPSSPQSRALEWLNANPQKVSELKFRPVLQKYVLLVLYYSTNGENWRWNSGWLSDSDECGWHNTAGRGNICDELGRVTDIDLRFNNLNGALPSELVLLKEHITKIRVNGNALQGTLPLFIGEMTNLERFHGHYNFFSGTIPTNLGGLIHLKSLRLRNNDITGTIPWQLRDLQNLEELVFESNKLSGTIPLFLGDLTNLNELNFGNNALTGTIPFEFMDLQKMVNLTLDRNNLTGSMPIEVCNRLPFLDVAKVDCQEVECSCCQGCND